MRLGRIAALVMLVGCAPDSMSGSPAGDVFERQGGASSACGLGWADKEAAGNVVHVREDGSDVDGDGSLRHPYATVDAALDGLRAGGHPGKASISVGPGVFETRIHLVQGDPKVDIVGCSASRTTLQAASATDPVVFVDGAKHGRLQGVTLAGGRRALRVSDGGRFDVRDAVVDGSTQVGVLVQDPQSTLRLHDTTIEGTLALDDIGWGAAVLDGGKLSMTGGGVYDSVGLGVFGDDADVTLDGVSVVGTTTTGRFGELGRGLHLQNGSTLSLTGGLFRDNFDAAVFLHDPKSVLINGIVIDITSAGLVIDFPSTGLSGDGIVVYGGQQTVSLSDNLITGSARAAILFDGVDATLWGNETDDNGLVIGGSSMFTQDDAEVDGDDASRVYDLQGPLLLNTWAIDADALR